jgi:hypothetical protein
VVPPFTSRPPLDRLAALDPTGAVGARAVAVARRVPLVTLAERVYALAEDALIRELAQRVRASEPRLLPPGGDGAPGAGGSDPGLRLSELLERSIEQTPQESERALADVILRELVPDEARILAALADGTAFPLIDVAVRRGPAKGDVLLANASSVGRAAGVVLPDRTPAYVAHLLALGLARTGPEQRDLREEYEILLTDARVRAAVEPARSRGGSARAVRRTLRISELGAAVWEGSRPPS